MVEKQERNNQEGAHNEAKELAASQELVGLFCLESTCLLLARVILKATSDNRVDRNSCDEQDDKDFS